MITNLKNTILKIAGFAMALTAFSAATGASAMEAPPLFELGKAIEELADVSAEVIAVAERWQSNRDEARNLRRQHENLSRRLPELRNQALNAARSHGETCDNLAWAKTCDSIVDIFSEEKREEPSFLVQYRQGQEFWDRLDADAADQSLCDAESEIDRLQAKLKNLEQEEQKIREQAQAAIERLHIARDHILRLRQEVTNSELNLGLDNPFTFEYLTALGRLRDIDLIDFNTTFENVEEISRLLVRGLSGEDAYNIARNFYRIGFRRGAFPNLQQGLTDTMREIAGEVLPWTRANHLYFPRDQQREAMTVAYLNRQMGLAGHGRLPGDIFEYVVRLVLAAPMPQRNFYGCPWGRCTIL